MKIFKREKGQSMVEFAFILPLLLLLLGATVDLGRIVYAKTQLQNISGDLLHMVILENEYSYNGGSFRSIEDKIVQEDFGVPADWLSPDKRDGYAIRKIFTEFVRVEGLDTNLIEVDRPEKYISFGPVKKGFDHKGRYPRLKKRLPGGEVINEWENEYDNLGFDKHGFDRLGYKKLHENSDERVDINGVSPEHPYAETMKHERWDLDGEIQVVGNSTYYREVTVTLPYEVENITFTGRMIFGDKTKLEQSISGIIYLGGDGRDITDPIYSGGDAADE